MHTAHRRLETYAPCAVQLAKLAVLIRFESLAPSRNSLLVFGPQQLQSRCALVQLVVHMRVVDSRAPRGLVAARVAKQQRLRLAVGHALHELPRQPRRLRALQVAADRSDCRRQRARYFTLAAAACLVQSQNFSNLSHGEAFRHPVAVAPLRGALDDSCWPSPSHPFLSPGHMARRVQVRRNQRSSAFGTSVQVVSERPFKCFRNTQLALRRQRRRRCRQHRVRLPPR